MIDSREAGDHLSIGTRAAGERASQLVRNWRGLWNHGLAPGKFESVFSPSVVFHFQDKTIVGAGRLRRFAQIAAGEVSRLDLVPVEIISHEDRVLLYYYWTADKWHSTIVGSPTRSNLCQAAFRLQEEAIVEVWQQAPDYICLLGTPTNGSAMSYPPSVPWHRFRRSEQGLDPAEDAETVRMCELFQMMNDCALGRSPLRTVSECMHPDVIFHFGDREGQGINAWKTFAHAIERLSGSCRQC